GASGNQGLLNGSFEEGTVGASNTPSSWSWTASGSGGTYALTSTSGEQAHGQNGFKITHPGGASNGGGYIQTDEFIPVGQGDFVYLGWKLKVSAANGAQNKVTLLWYKPDQTASTTTSTIRPTAQRAGRNALAAQKSQAMQPFTRCACLAVIRLPIPDRQRIYFLMMFAS
ncbi:MAG: hypothetical protein VW907_08485, partial [Opitutae bacterium]